MRRLAVLDDYQGVALEMADWSVLDGAVEVEVFRDHLSDPDRLAARLEPYEIVALMRERTPVRRELLRRLPNLRLLVTTGMRNRSIDLAAASDQGVVVCGTGGMHEPTAELTWALLLALARNIPEEARNVAEGRWQSTIGTVMSGKTLGVLGLGTIGAHVTRIALAFGMEVIAWSQNLTTERAMRHGAKLVGRDELFRLADAVTIHVVLSERTRGLVGRRELGLMKPDAYLVNTSRGPIVDEDALVEALERGRIAGAALDVYETEPLPADHRLRHLPRAVLTPHIGYVAREEYQIFFRDIVEDVRAYLDGQPVRVLAP